MRPKISIVIAMYNIQAYIAECIESCLHQDGVNKNDYEIILVNDGSTDDSLSIAANIVKGIENVTIVTQKNGGVSVARNTGIEYAKGEYIWFVDGDDKIEPLALRTLLTEIEKTTCDIYIFNYSSFNHEGIVELSDFERYDLPLPGKKINEDYDRVLPNLVWAAIYRYTFLKEHQLCFMPGIRHEDDEFTMRVNYLADSIVILKEHLYRYRISNVNSFMGQLKKDNTESFVSLLKIRESHNSFWGKYSPFYNRRRGHFAFILVTYRYDLSFNQDNCKLFDQVKWGLYADVLHYGSWKRKVFILLSICLPSKFTKKILKKSGLLLNQ